MTDKLASAKDLQLRIKGILLREWDPIGVCDIPEAQDEYDAYVSHIHTLLIRRTSRNEIFDYLWWVETKHMELCGDRQATKTIADNLASLLSE